METKSPQFWWMKSPQGVSVPKLNLSNSNSISELLEHEDKYKEHDSDVDVDSILEEISRVAAESPLGPYEKNMEERSIDEIMKEAEKVYLESSKSFEQLSQRSKTSQNISDLLNSNSDNSTPTPKSISPLPMDPTIDKDVESDNSEYSADFSQESKIESHKSPIIGDVELENHIEDDSNVKLHLKSDSDTNLKIPSNIVLKSSENTVDSNANETMVQEKIIVKEIIKIDTLEIDKLNKEIEFRNDLIRTLEEDNQILKSDVNAVKIELQNTIALLQKTKLEANSNTLSSPEINLELEKALEQLKDSKEINTALQLQLDTINKGHQFLKNSYDDLMNSNKTLERRLVELDSTLDKYKSELSNVQQTKEKLLENEANLNKLLEIEKLQAKTLKIQNEKDAKCIQDLNRQIREMERIIARKHPDSVSALIVAAKEDATDTNLTARKILEDRIKILEQEVLSRDSQSSKVFLDIQEKFNQMKNKYESHIEDLELHVSDLKNQLKKKNDTYDVYTQTVLDENKIPRKETYNVFTQTDVIQSIKPKPSPVKKSVEKEVKEDAHLLATIRGLQADLSNKEKVVLKQQKDIDELRKTNRRLQKEREGSLRNLSERKEFRSYPEKLSIQSRSNSASSDFRKDEEIVQIKSERNRLKQQLQTLEGDYQILKKKRLDDLTALQEAHEREIATYVTSITPLREQLEVQQVSIGALQQQLVAAREELALTKAERDHLNSRLLILNRGPHDISNASDNAALLEKVSSIEKQYEEREYRLRGILHSLAQKCVLNRNCEQCSERQQQLVAYKVELDQLLATVRALH